ncbi:MAG: molecular chaperone TorD family protein, partial [Anaerolineae bacterium]
MRADLYAVLAEALAEPPAWLADAGHAWPLTGIVGRLPARAPARRWLPVLAAVPAEPPALRRARYVRLFEGTNGPPRFWLYESAATTGRILGPQAAAVAALYRAAGVTPALGAELPDHAALELAFLAHLPEQAAADPAQAAGWRAAERQFLQQHAAWLIELGRGLAADGDAVYAPIGALLADWLSDLTPDPSPAEDLTPGPSPARRGELATPFPGREGGRGVRSPMREGGRGVRSP